MLFGICLALLIETEITAAFSRVLAPTSASASIRRSITIRNSKQTTQSSSAMSQMAMSQNGTSESLNETVPLNNVVLWIGSTTSMFVAVTFFALLAVKRDALMVSFFIGAINNGILSKVLKKLLNQERPAEISAKVKDKPNDKVRFERKKGFNPCFLSKLTFRRPHHRACRHHMQ